MNITGDSQVERGVDGFVTIRDKREKLNSFSAKNPDVVIMSKYFCTINRTLIITTEDTMLLVNALWKNEVLA